MPLSETVLILSGLLAVAMIAAGVCRNWPVPYTVVLVVIGVGLGELARVFPPLAPLHEFHLSPDVVFSIFLPALIFESGLNLDARQLVKDLAPVLVLAIPALLISTAVIGTGLALALDVEPITALLFGALISATDPVAVVALFKELGAPQRLRVLVEGEALMNDATAIVVFGILLGVATEGVSPSAGVAARAVGTFLRVFLGGAAVGAALGLAVSELIRRLRSGRSAVLTLSLVTAYASFILAEHVLHLSGVMASAAAALSLGVFGVTRMPRETVTAMEETWELFALVCNSLLFLLLGLSVEPGPLGSRLGPVLTVVALLLAARAAAVYGLVPLTTRLFSLPRVTAGEQHIMWWGGLKGGLAIAIVLSTPPDLPGRGLLLDLTLGVVLFTLLVNAPSIRPLMKWLGLDRLSDEEGTELRRSLLAARHCAEGDLDRFRHFGLVSTETDLAIRRKVWATLKIDTPRAAWGRQDREAYLAALRTEFEELNRLSELGAISQYIFLDIRTTLLRDREAHASGGLRTPVAGERQSPFLRLERALLRRLREQDWAARLMSRYQDRRMAQRLQRDMAGILMCETVLTALASNAELEAAARVALERLYAERLARRRHRVDAVRREFPEFFERFETGLLTRVALRSAMRSAEHDHHHGEIGAKAFTHVEHRIRGALSGLAPLDEALPHHEAGELIASVPLLSGLSERSLAALAERAHTVTFLAGDIVIGEGERGDALYVITHGSVSVCQETLGGRRVSLREMYQGDFFGELALLGDQLRTATVTARTPSTLLRLARRDVLDLAERNPEVAQRLEDARRARRNDVDEPDGPRAQGRE
ncbi:MAG: cation:proton antiporter [Deltaproteobacteria bacterium]|nr:cation:proton antiporter [Deltaproteobacteria bacterium]MBW2363139.1 cation:proton antiporter [Deltaproteobacteria bacterium]